MTNQLLLVFLLEVKEGIIIWKLKIKDMTNELDILNETLYENSLLIKGLGEKLTPEELDIALSQMLFEVTERLPIKLVEVRDRDAIREVGPFRYSGQADTLTEEGLMPENVCEGLASVGLDRHIGPSYLRVKSLLTDGLAREFFGRQLAYVIRDYLVENPPNKPDGLVVCIPNMTGGAQIGDETRKQMQEIGVPNVWPATPYFRGARKPIDAVSGEPRMIDFIEGLMPPPENTGIVICFEELRTASETTRNALRAHRHFGYGDENDVRQLAASVFDYRHPVGVARLGEMNVEGLYLVGGKEFFDASKDLGYITDSQYETGIHWLTNPWTFTREVIEDIKRLQGE